MRTDLLVVPIFALCLPAQTTHVVDALGGVGVHTTLQSAVLAATDGNVIEVRPTGVYDFTLTTDKGVTIVGVGATAPRFRGKLSVTGLPAGRQFVFRRFQPAFENACLLSNPVRSVVR